MEPLCQEPRHRHLCPPALAGAGHMNGPLARRLQTPSRRAWPCCRIASTPGPACFTRNTLSCRVMPRTGTGRDGAGAGVTGKDAGRPGTAMGEPGRPGRFRLPFRMPGDARAPKGAGWPIPQKARPSWCALCRCGCGLARPARPDFRGKGAAAASCEGNSAFVARASPGLACDIRQVDQHEASRCAQTRTGQPGRTFSAMTGTDLPPQGGRRGMGSGPGCVPSVPPAFQTFGTTSPGLATPSARATWRFTATKLSGDTEIESIPALTSSLAKAGSLLGA